MTNAVNGGWRAAADAGARAHCSPIGARIQLWGVAFVLPTILFFVVFKYGPMIAAMELSFTSYDMVSTPAIRRPGELHQPRGDPVFRESLLNTFVYIAGSTALITSSASGLRSRSTRAFPAPRYCMTAMFLTNLMPIIAVCLRVAFPAAPLRRRQSDAVAPSASIVSTG